MTKRNPKNAHPGPRNPRVQVTLDMAYRLQHQGNLSQAEVLYHQVLKDEPGNPFSLYALGTLAMSRHQYAAAVPLLEQALANGYDDETVLTHLGIALQLSGRPDDALSLYKSASERHPKNARYPANAAVILALREDFAAAESAVQHALKLDPNCVPALINGGTLYRQMDKPAEAIALFQHALKLDPGNEDAKQGLAALIEVPESGQ